MEAAAAAGEGTLDISGDRRAPTSYEEATKEVWPSETLEARKTDSKCSISKCCIEIASGICVPVFAPLLLLVQAPENGAEPSFHYSQPKAHTSP